MLLSQMTGVRFSFTGHARDIFELTPPPILAEKVARARFVVAVSEFTREHIQGIARAEDRDKVVVVRNGLNASSFSPRRIDPNGVPLLLSVGRLVEKKGHDTLLAAGALLRDRGLAFRIEVIGEGPLRAQLEDQSRQLGLNGQVVLAGSRDHGQVRAAYDRAHVFVLPCRQTSVGDRDGLPVAIVEAMAVGVPVVSTLVAGIPELVADDISGILVPPDDPARLADAIERVLSDGALRSRLVAGGRTVASRYNLPESVTRLRRYFSEADFPSPARGGGQGGGLNSPPPLAKQSQSPNSPPPLPKESPRLGTPPPPAGEGQGGGLRG
jgi:glycosyltransferase involved in cell wall biosynthesis